MTPAGHHAEPGPQGILLIDKAQGWTSHDVVAKARGITRQRRVGHTGTLDPMATGLLVLCLGNATRLVEYMSAHDKEYEGVITLGQRTDTDDSEGGVTETRAVPPITASVLRALEGAFTGEIMQRPPAFSAVQIGGQRAYAVARRGGAVEIAARPVRVDAITLQQTSPSGLEVSVHCGPGTYIRSLARDIGETLGCGAHLSALRRTRVGRFDVGQAVDIEALAAITGEGCLADVLLELDEGVTSLDVAIVEAGHARQFSHGSTLAVQAKSVAAAADLRVYDPAGRFLGVAGLAGHDILRPLKVLSNGTEWR